MKKIGLFLVLMTTLLSCSLDDPDRYDYYILPVESYILPETFVVGGTHQVKLQYQKPTNCYNYGGIYFDKGSDPESFTRTIGIYANVKVGESCSEELPPLTEVSFNFVPQKAGTFTFKFYKGKNDLDEDIFEEVPVVVTE